jgi:hypothetical protein
MPYSVEKKRGFPIHNDPEVTVIHVWGDETTSENAGAWLEKKTKQATEVDPKVPDTTTVADVIAQREADRQRIRDLFEPR